MNFVDVFGYPAAGKSSICDPLWGHRAVGWDGLNPPAEWAEFLDEVTKAFYLIQGHPTLSAAVRMNDRSAKKMSTVFRMEGSGPYIQTGWVQRITGFGWRLADMGRDVNLIRPMLRKVPVSAGFVFLSVDPEEAKRRNRARRLVPETSHEDRSHMIDPMTGAIKIAKEVLHERGVRCISIDVQHQSIDAARAELVAFANAGTAEPEAGRHCSQAPLLSPPIWWQG